MTFSSAAGGIIRQNVDIAVQVTDAPRPASWVSMPQKKQLALIAFARFCETVADGSLQSYIFFQLRSFTLPDGSAPSVATVAFQLSVLRATVATPGLFTSTLLGMLADHPRVGRKRIIILGLATSGVASLGCAFTRSFGGAVLCRLLLGLVNGKKAAMRSMIREISGDKFESRAVLLLPAAFNVGSIVGPVLGGFLAQGDVSGTSGMRWFPRWPFALPNIVNGIMLLVCASLIAFNLRETLPDAGAKRRRRASVSLIPGWAKRLHRKYFRRQPQYEPLADQEHELEEQGECQAAAAPDLDDKHQYISIWTQRLAMTLAARALLIMHIFSYPSLLLLFASTPRYKGLDDTSILMQRATAPMTTTMAENDLKTNGSSSFVDVPPGYHPHAPFIFTGGLGFQPDDIAIVLAIRGIVGVLLQLLFFPYLRDLFGTLRLYRCALVVFPVTYFVTPYLATVTSSALPPLPAAGATLWTAMSAILVVQSTARSLALPAGAMLLNAACPDRSVLGTVNGIGQSVSSGARAIGHLLVTGWLYGMGLEAGIVGVAWWAMAGVAIAATVAAACVPAGSDGSYPG